MIFNVQKEQFLHTLHEELIKRGIPPAAAGQYVRAIAQTLTDKDTEEIAQIRDSADVAKLAQGIVMVKQRSAAQNAAKEENEDDDVKVYRGAGSISRKEASPPTDTDYDEYIHDDDPEPQASVRGKRIFWLIFFCALPLTLILLLAYFGVFGAIFAALCAVIVLLVAGLIGGAAVGAVVSLVGIVYGIMQLITAASAAPGLYEIGLGITVGGVVMAGGILVYNIAIRLIPFLIRLLASLFGFCTGKLRTLFHMAKEACYRL